MNIGENILKLRKKEKLSQEQLAEKMGVTRQTISNWELGESNPDIRQAKLLSKIFKVSLDDLTNNEIKNLLVEKVSNTEKLAGIIINILKFLGLLIVLYIIFIIVMIIIFNVYRTNKSITQDNSEVSMSCIKGNSTYDIVFNSDKKYICKGCSDDMNDDIKGIIDFENLDISIKNIENYFEKINGICE